MTIFAAKAKHWYNAPRDVAAKLCIACALGTAVEDPVQHLVESRMLERQPNTRVSSHNWRAEKVVQAYLNQLPQLHKKPANKIGERCVR